MSLYLLSSLDGAVGKSKRVNDLITSGLSLASLNKTQYYISSAVENNPYGSGFYVPIYECCFCSPDAHDLRISTDKHINCRKKYSEHFNSE